MPVDSSVRFQDFAERLLRYERKWSTRVWCARYKPEQWWRDWGNDPNRHRWSKWQWPYEVPEIEVNGIPVWLMEVETRSKHNEGRLTIEISGRVPEDWWLR